MTQLRNRETGILRDSLEVEREIRAGTSCGPVINFDDFGYDVVFPSPQPAYDPIRQSVIQNGAILTDKGHYEQVWKVVALSAEQIAANLAAQQQADIVRYELKLDEHLDSVAQAHRFADRKTLALRAAYPNAWQALAVAYGSWMDACNVQAYQLLQDVIDGKKQMPTVEAFIGGLPAFVAP